MINSLEAKTNRGYLSVKELLELLGITYNSNLESTYLPKIEKAEEIIDSYVGYVEKHVIRNYVGKADSGTTTTIVSTTPLNVSTFLDNYLEFCVVEIVSGTNKGERRSISTNTNYTITVRDAFTSAIDSTSAFKIYQLGKFPRLCDADYITEMDKWVKSIPDQIKRAVAYQVAYMETLGTDYAQNLDIKSESLGDWSATYRDNSRSISPIAKELLIGYRVGVGKIV